MHISSIKIQPLVKNINSVVIRMFIFFKISFYKVIVFEFTYQLPVVVLIEFLFKKLMFHSLQKYNADNRNIAACLNTLTGRCGTCFSIHTAHVVGSTRTCSENNRLKSRLIKFRVSHHYINVETIDR